MGNSDSLFVLPQIWSRNANSKFDDTFLVKDRLEILVVEPGSF